MSIEWQSEIRRQCDLSCIFYLSFVFRPQYINKWIVFTGCHCCHQLSLQQKVWKQRCTNDFYFHRFAFDSFKFLFVRRNREKKVKENQILKYFQFFRCVWWENITMFYTLHWKSHGIGVFPIRIWWNNFSVSSYFFYAFFRSYVISKKCEGKKQFWKRQKQQQKHSDE